MCVCACAMQTADTTFTSLVKLNSCLIPVFGVSASVHLRLHEMNMKYYEYGKEYPVYETHPPPRVSLEMQGKKCERSSITDLKTGKTLV